MNSAPLHHLVYGNVADPLHPQARGFRIVHGPSRFDSEALDALAKRFSSCAPKSQDPNAASMAYLPWMHNGEPYGCLVQHLQPLAQDDQGRPAGFFHALLFPRHTPDVDPLHNALACAASFHRESLDGNPARFLELVRAPDLAGDPSVRVEDLTRVLEAVGGADPVTAFVDAVHRVTQQNANASFFAGDIRRMPTLLKLLPAGLAYAAAWSFGVKGLTEPHLILDSSPEQQSLFGAPEPEALAWADWLHQRLAQNDRGWIEELQRAHDITNWWDMGRLTDLSPAEQLLTPKQRSAVGAGHVVSAAAAHGAPGGTSTDRRESLGGSVSAARSAHSNPSAPSTSAGRSASASSSARAAGPSRSGVSEVLSTGNVQMDDAPTDNVATDNVAKGDVAKGDVQMDNLATDDEPTLERSANEQADLTAPTSPARTTSPTRLEPERPVARPDAAASSGQGDAISAAELDRQIVQVEQRLQQYVEQRLELQGPIANATHKPGWIRRGLRLLARLRPEIYFILGLLFASALFALQTPLEWLGDLITRWIIR